MDADDEVLFIDTLKEVKSLHIHIHLLVDCINYPFGSMVNMLSKMVDRKRML
jgi:hypothetical protein